MLQLLCMPHPVSASTCLVSSPDQWDGIVADVVAQTHPADSWVRVNRVKPMTVGEVEELHRFASSTPVSGHKVAVLDGASEWRAEVANALLKLLEEPPAYLTLLLLSEREQLLPTVRSRVQLHTLPRTSSVEGWRGMLTRSQVAGADSSRVTTLMQLTPLVHGTINTQLVVKAFSTYLHHD